MKVLQINAVYGFKSTGVIVKDIENLLNDNGHTAFVAYQTAVNPPQNSYKIGNKSDWKIHAILARVFGKQAYFSRIATKKLLKYIEKIRPDVVHLHNLHSNYINLNILCDYLAEKNIKTVYTLHDCWCFTGKCSHYVAVGCDKWQSSCGSCPQNKCEQPSLFFDATSKVLKDKTEHLNKIKDLTLVACSEWIKAEAEKSLLKPKNITVIYNGVDTGIFKPHKSSFKEQNGFSDEFVIMGMADKWCLEENKIAVQKIVESNKDSKIVIVGCNKAQKQMFDNYNNVLALEYVKDRKKLADIYSSCDVFVNLTHADTLPTVNMESISSGTPVITYDCCGSPELVDQDSGFVVKENDVDALLTTIAKLKEQPLKIDISSAHKKFDKNSCYNKYLEVYNDCGLSKR